MRVGHALGELDGRVGAAAGDDDDLVDHHVLQLLGEQRVQRPRTMLCASLCARTPTVQRIIGATSLDARSAAGASGAGRSWRFSHCQPTRIRLAGSHIIEL